MAPDCSHVGRTGPRIRSAWICAGPPRSRIPERIIGERPAARADSPSKTGGPKLRQAGPQPRSNERATRAPPTREDVEVPRTVGTAIGAGETLSYPSRTASDHCQRVGGYRNTGNTCARRTELRTHG